MKLIQSGSFYCTQISQADSQTRTHMVMHDSTPLCMLTQTYNTSPTSQIFDQAIRLFSFSPDLFATLQEICNSDQGIDESTIPHHGINSAPEQVIVNISVPLSTLRAAHRLLSKIDAEYN